MDLTTPAGLEAYLENTEYAAADVQIMSGGYSGFTYRVILKSPLPTGETSVVIKHVAECASWDRRTMHGVERMDFEHEALQMIGSSSLFSSTSIVQVPRVLSYDPDTHTLVMVDLSPVRLLSEVLIECLESGDEARTRQVSSQAGAALGDFMGRFHMWTSLPEQGVLRKRFLENRASSEMCLARRYDRVLAKTTEFGLWQAWIDEMLFTGLQDARDGGSVIAMGDFWFNNILVSEDSTEGFRLYIIDWEMARCARPELDVGSFAMMAYSIANMYPHSSCPGLVQEFYMSYRKHFSVDVVQVALSCGTDVTGYGASAPWMAGRGESALEAVTKAGVHLLEAAREKDTDLIKVNVVLRDMYAIDTVVV